MTNFIQGQEINTVEDYPGLGEFINKLGASNQPTPSREGTEDKIINGKRYTIKLLGGVVGIQIFTDIAKVLAPSSAVAVDSYMDAERFLRSEGTFESIVNRFVSNLSTPDVLRIVYTLLKDCMVDDKPLNIDEYFKGNYGDILELVWFALQANFETAFTQSGLKARFLNLMREILGQEFTWEGLSELLRNTNFQETTD